MIFIGLPPPPPDVDEVFFAQKTRAEQTYVRLPPSASERSVQHQHPAQRMETQNNDAPLPTGCNEFSGVQANSVEITSGRRIHEHLTKYGIQPWMGIVKVLEFNDDTIKLRVQQTNGECFMTCHAEPYVRPCGKTD